jgi:hypothetical protein
MWLSHQTECSLPAAGDVLWVDSGTCPRDRRFRGRTTIPDYFAVDEHFSGPEAFRGAEPAGAGGGLNDADLPEADGERGPETVARLVEGLDAQTDAGAIAATREFLEPDFADGVAEKAALYESAGWMKDVATRELRLYVADLNTRLEARAALDGCEESIALLDVETVVAAFEAFLHPWQPDEVLNLMALPVRDMWTSLAEKYSRSGFAQLAEVALRVLALPASQAHQERLNKHLRRITHACGARLGDETEYARLILSACDDLPSQIQARIREVADTGGE